MQDITGSAFDLCVIPDEDLAGVSGGKGYWEDHVAATKKRLQPSFESPTPDLKEVLCGIGALREGKKTTNADGTARTPAQQVSAARGSRALCRKMPELPNDEVSQ
jgi:hypothetical protein